MPNTLAAFLIALCPFPAQGPARPAAALDRALGAIRPQALAADLRFLACDELGGRDTPSEGLSVASLFLRARLQRLGLRPAGPDGFFDLYTLVERRLDPDASGLFLEAGDRSERLLFGSDYFLSRTSHVRPREVRGPVVSAGSGAREDFRTGALEGAWALVFDQGLSARRALRYAGEAGAVGVLLVDDGGRDRTYEERFRAQTRVALETHVGYAGFETEHADGEPALLMLSAEAGARLLAASTAAWHGERPPPGLSLGIELHEVRALAGGEVPVRNVLGFWPGDDPELAHEVIVVSAHYDHVGTREGEVYNGADDNASGTTGLLGVAEALAAYGPLARSVLLLWVSGEEKGLWGSHAWASDPVLPPGHVPVADLNIDMIGRTAPEELYVTPSRDHDSYNALARAAYELSPLEGFPELASQDRDWARSDHFNFDRLLRIPVLFLSAGEHEDYHQPSDTADKIDYDKLARITRLVVRILDRVQREPLERRGK